MAIGRKRVEDMEEEKRQGQARQGWDDGNHGWPMWKELRQLDSEHIHILSGIQREWVRSAPEMKIHGNVGRAVIANILMMTLMKS